MNCVYFEIYWNTHNTNATRFRRSGTWSAEVLDTSVDHAAFGQHHGVRQYGRAIVSGGRRTRTDVALQGPTVGRHTAVPVGRATPVGRRVGFDTDDCGRGDRPGAQRWCRTAATTAAQLVAATKQQHHQRWSDIRRDGTLNGVHSIHTRVVIVRLGD